MRSGTSSRHKRNIARAHACSSWRERMEPTDIDVARILLRHLVATLTYRAAKVLRETPSDFGTMTFGSSTRQPVLIVAHLADLMSWAVRMANGEPSWKAEGSDEWNAERSEERRGGREGGTRVRVAA